MRIFINLLIWLVFFIPTFGISQSIPKLEFYKYNPVRADNSSLLETMKYVNELERAEFERNREKEKNRMASKMLQTKSIYSNFKKFPLKITDGWHNVIATNNYDFCDDRKVYVSNNQVTRYIIDDWEERAVTFSNTISQGKGLIKNKRPDGAETEYLEIYFLDFCLNPDTHTSPPIKPGKVTFWTSWKKANTITLYIEGFELGTFTHYFDSSPSCEQQGTISFVYKPGTYKYQAVGTTALGKQLNWEGSITLKEGSCIMQGLSKN